MRLRGYHAYHKIIKKGDIFFVRFIFWKVFSYYKDLQVGLINKKELNMGAQLWMSPVTGYRRKGTRFDSLHAIFVDKITLTLIFEPILCCKENDEASNARYALEKRDFDITAVVNDQGIVIGQVRKDALTDGFVKQFMEKIDESCLISEDVPIVDLLTLLENDPYKYVTSKGHITGIVTRADLNKPLPRTYLFGIVSLVEMHMTYWISAYFPDDSWTEKLKENRLKQARDVHAQRQSSNDAISLLECIQLCDKKTILMSNDDFLSTFSFESKKRFKIFMEAIERIRNEIAHNQNSIIAGMEWDTFVDTFHLAKDFLETSDKIIEADCEEKSREHAQDILVSVSVK